MNRYKITFSNGQELLLYKKSKEMIDIKLYSDIGEIVSIDLYENNIHEYYIEKIKETSEFIGYDKCNHETYKCKYYKGFMYIYLVKDKEDDTYYDYAQYIEFLDHRFMCPIIKTMSTPEQVYKLIITNNPQYIIYSHRYYGEPKLTKPKELKGIKQIGSVDFIPNKCKVQIFVKEQDIYVKHSDYFSSSWQPPSGERIDMPTSYYLKKYFNKNKSEKFIYSDCWGSIVLRNEAWILLKDILPLIETENEVIAARKIIDMQKKDKYSKINSCNENEWENFWGRVANFVKNTFK